MRLDMFLLTPNKEDDCWDELTDIPVDENECLDIDWLFWDKGTHREEIWEWFDYNHSKGVYWLIYEREKEEDRG